MIISSCTGRPSRPRPLNLLRPRPQRPRRVGCWPKFEGLSRAQYDSDLGDEAPSEEDVFILPVPQTPNLINFGDLSKFESLIDVKEIEIIRRRYSFHRDYEIRVPEANDRAHIPPPGMVAIYTNQLKAGLRIPTSTFIRSSLRHWATRITELTIMHSK